MKAHTLPARPDWQKKAADVGFIYHTGGLPPAVAGFDGAFWDETRAYEFTLAEIIEIEHATSELHLRCLNAVDYIVRDNPRLMDDFRIPASMRPAIIDSWNSASPTLYGRFDLAFDPNGQQGERIKMLEYNADTPTMVIETAMVQWQWMKDVCPDTDQFNSLHERLIDQWARIGGRMNEGAVLHFSSHADYPEEWQHIQYFMDTALQAGLRVKHVPITEVGWDGWRFVDLDNEPITHWFKLYPWEWMVREAFGAYLPKVLPNLGVIEPPWKMLLSNKAILPVLWSMFPNHPNLLPASFSAQGVGPNYVKKPILAREGANITMVEDTVPTMTTDGSYADSPMVYQTKATMPVFDGRTVVLGSWIVGDEPAGMILREGEGRIVINTSRIVPHFIRD